MNTPVLNEDKGCPCIGDSIVTAFRINVNIHHDSSLALSEWQEYTQELHKLLLEIAPGVTFTHEARDDKGQWHEVMSTEQCLAEEVDRLKEVLQMMVGRESI